MASRKIFFGSKPNYIYPTMELDVNPSSDHDHHNNNNNNNNNNNHFEFDEADVIWNNNFSADHQSSAAATTTLDAKIKPLPTSRASSKKLYRKMDDFYRTTQQRGAPPPPAASASSLPVNIPDWSKILKDEYREHGKSDEDADNDGGGGADDDLNGRVPPHEYLARRRGASFSVHEGIGRTLKGRDLRRVRNAIWKKTGFED